MLVVPSHAALAHNDRGRTLVRVLYSNQNENRSLGSDMVEYASE